VAWIERYLSVCGVSVEALHERGHRSLLEELMDDFMALLRRFRAGFTSCGPNVISSVCSMLPASG
jgi:hypothetical protein